MENLEFDEEITALLVIDPYNDFVSDGDKLAMHIELLHVGRVFITTSAAGGRNGRQHLGRVGFFSDNQCTD